MKAYIDSVGLNTWDQFRVRWERLDLSLWERLGLIHYGYTMVIPESDVISRVTRFAFYLELADLMAMSREDSRTGGKELSLKARSVLVAKVFGKSCGNDLKLAYEGGEHGKLLLSLLGNFFCNEGSGRKHNWSFCQVAGNHEDIVLTDAFVSLFILIVGDGYELKECNVDDLKGRVVFTFFFMDPHAFWMKIRRLDDGNFTIGDLQILASKIRGLALSDNSETLDSLDEWVGRCHDKGAETHEGVWDLIGRGCFASHVYWDALTLIIQFIRRRNKRLAPPEV